MISVVHITEAFCGGVATYLRTILPMLVSPDCRVSLICSLERAEPDAGATIDRLEMAGLSVSVVPMQREVAPRSDVKSFGRLVSLLSLGRYDVVHTHSAKAGALGRLAARLVGLPLIVHTPHCFAFLRSIIHIVGITKRQADLAATTILTPSNRCHTQRRHL